MAPPAGTLRVGRYFLALIAILAVLYGLVFFPGQSHAPKLGLDLQGGTQVIYQADTPNGKQPSKSEMTTAQQIMENRVNGNGVSDAQVVVQGGNEIQITIAGKSSQDIADIGTAAQLNFRPLVMPAVYTAAAQAAIAAQQSASAVPSATGSAATGSAAAPSATPTPAKTTAAVSSPTATSTHSAQDLDAKPLGGAAAISTAKPSTTPAATPSATTSATTAATPSASATAPAGPALSANPLASITFPIPTSETAYDALTSTQQTQLQTAVSTFDCSSKPTDTATKDYLACDSSDNSQATTVYLLGPVIVPGTQISSASAVAPGSSADSVTWSVSLSLKGSGQAAWSKYTAAHNTGGQTPTGDPTSCGASSTPCADYVAFTLDGVVISSPYNSGAINGDTSISGGNPGFTQTTANQLANELKYGALPLSFNLLSNNTVSATLGSGQLKAGLLAGGIGLILVVIYSLIYYRALGFVTIASLLVSGGLTYGSLVVLGREMGFTLTLAGIAGFIVAIGITADSFVVFFERMKDEVHDGRSMRVAVPRAWVRARRTILSADTVSFLAAAVLYYFAAGDVQGFAFTLGLSTILDLVVVFLFTHPLVSLLSRSKAFGSRRFTGLDSAREGGVAQAAESHRKQPTKRPAAKASTPAPPKKASGSPAPVGQNGKPAGIVMTKDDGEPAEAPAEAVDPVDDASTELVDGVSDSFDAAPEADAAVPPRTVGDPAPGSAAERAAARRAKLRAEKNNANKGGQR